ncbi:glycosyltransferase family 4 protein, partial [Streptomyces griseiscabiei]|uniref:glycosyltransferase family 4 protein n=1 Tax=Streptomyces griseiscabiei TaxID=2993540 RepID=UPI00117EC46F
MKISFLLHNAYAIGGTIRSTLNLAGALAARHEVEIVSVLRTADRPQLGLSAKVRLVPLVDERPDARTYDGGHELMSRPSALVPPDEVLAHRYTALTDERLRAFLDSTDADVLVATRPALVVLLAEHGPRHAVRIGQEHLTYDNHVPGVREAQNAAIARLDAFVTVSERDAADHRRRLPGPRTRITNIANAAPRSTAEPSDLRAPLVIAAGRLYPVKRYDLLIEAFAKVVAERPEWRLRIYGKGPERANLRTAIDTSGLNDHVFLMGPYASLDAEWAKASVAVVSSEWESFGMTILEAMHAGVPVVATDCPHGPGEIITDGTDGLLVPPSDPNALATGLLRLIDDPGLRERLGTAGRTTVQRYAPRTVAGVRASRSSAISRSYSAATVRGA